MDAGLTKVEGRERLGAEFTVFLEWAVGKANRGSSCLEIPTTAWHCRQGGGRPSASPLDPGMLRIAGRAGTLSVVSGV